MFFEWQKLDVCEAHLLDVVGKRLGHLTVSERAILVFYPAAPRTEVDFVNRKWFAEVFTTGATLHPLRIAKLVPRRVDNRRSVRWDLSELSVRISFEKWRSIRRADLKLVETAFLKLWNEQLPNARGSQRTHPVLTSIPTIEISNHTD